MFDIGSTELLLIVVVAILVIGPKDLPRALYKVGQVVGKARGMARHFRSGLDAMVREAELEELQKQWAQENARIMAETQLPDLGGTMKPLTDTDKAAGSPPSSEKTSGPAPETTTPASDEAMPAIQTAPPADVEPRLPLDPAPPAADAPKGSIPS